MKKQFIQTNKAPAAIGTYSQAVRVDNTIYISGQIPVEPETMNLITENIELEIEQVFHNLQAICEAAGGDLSDIAKLNIYLTDLTHFPTVNTIMAKFFKEPYPARAVIGVAQLPKSARVEMDAIMVITKENKV